MTLDSVCLDALCYELKDIITGARIDKINMPERALVIMTLFVRGENLKLLLSSDGGSARVHITAQKFENPTQPPMFCMLLRKHLLGARILSLEQPNNERVIRINFECRNELGVLSLKSLVVEMIGRSKNIILLDDTGRIIDCIRHIHFDTNEKHPLLPGVFYELPPQQNKKPFFSCEDNEIYDFCNSIGDSNSLDQYILDHFSGLSPLVCRELAASSNLKQAMISLRELYLKKHYSPVMLFDNGCPVIFSFMPIFQFGTLYTSQSFFSFSELLDYFYTERDKQQSLKRRSSDILRTVKTAQNRVLRKIALQKQELRQTEKREELRHRGDLITSNIYRLKRGMSSFEAEDFYLDGCPVVTVLLDPLKTPQQNAAANYKAYNKAKRANELLSGFISEEEQEVDYLDSVIDELNRVTCERDIIEIQQELITQGYIRLKGQNKVKKIAGRKPLHFVSDSGMDIFAGRSNLENDELTFRAANNKDYWMHAQKIHGSHVIIASTNNSPDEITLHQAAVIAATLSQAKGGKTAVDYTEVKHVKKHPNSKPGAVIYTDYHTIVAEPDKKLVERLKKERQ